MSQLILVPLRDDDRIAEITPRLEFHAQAGTEICFLIPRNELRYPWWLEHAGCIDRVAGARSIKDLEEDLSRKRRLLRAEEFIAAAQKRLQGRMVTIRGMTYSGSLEKAIMDYRDDQTEITVLTWKKLGRLQRLLMAVRQMVAGQLDAKPYSNTVS